MVLFHNRQAPGDTDFVRDTAILAVHPDFKWETSKGILHDKGIIRGVTPRRGSRSTGNQENRAAVKRDVGGVIVTD